MSNLFFIQASIHCKKYIQVFCKKMLTILFNKRQSSVRVLNTHIININLKQNTMKKITLLLIALLVAMVSYSQVFFEEDFNGTTQPSGWFNFSSSSGGTQQWGFGSGVTPGTDIADFTTNAAIFNDPTGSNVAFLYKNVVDITNVMNDADYALIYKIRTSLNTFGSDNQPDKLSIKVSDVSFSNTSTPPHTIWETTTEHDPNLRFFDIKSFLNGSSWNLDYTEFRIGVVFDDVDGSNGWGAGIDDVSFYARQYNDNNYNSLPSEYIISSLPYKYSQEADNQTNVTNIPTGSINNCSAMSNGLWYKYVADFSGQLTIHGRADNYDVQINAYVEGTGLQCLGSKDNELHGQLESLIITVVQGQTYWFNVGHWSVSATASLMHGTQHIWVDKTPSNDSCADALDFTSDATNLYNYQGSIVGATNDGNYVDGYTGCSANAMNDGVNYKFTAPYSGEFNFRVFTTQYDVQVVASDSCPISSGCLEIADDNHSISGWEEIVLDVVAGTEYYFVIGHTSNVTDFVEEGITEIQFFYTAPANNSCGNASSLTVGTNFDQHDIIVNNLGTTASGGTTPNPTCGFFGSGQDLWCSVVVPSNGNLTIETSSFPGSPIVDTVIAAYSSNSNTCSNLTQVECDDDDGIGIFSKLVLTGQTPGDTLLIRAWEWGNNTFGKFKISAYNTSTATVEEDTIEGLNLYPNPVNDTLNIDSQEEITQLSIFNVLGKLVKTIQPNKTTSSIDLSDLETGIYMVKIEADTKISTQKIIKK